VAPLLHGGGTRLKILEAAASGKAIVSTSRGTEGLQFRVGEDIVVADSAPAFAQAVVDLLRDAPRRRALGRRARDVARQHDWEQIGRQVCRIVEDVAERAHPATRQSDGVMSPTGAIAADGS
jgi:polysaccharide biosynthesis protein PslH